MTGKWGEAVACCNLRFNGCGAASCRFATRPAGRATPSMVFYLAFFPLTVYVMTSFSELCMPKPALILHLVLTVTLAHLCRGEDILLAKGEKITGEVSGGGGTWRVGSENLRMSEVLCIRFSSDPAPDHIPAGVFIRGGALI